MRLEPAALRSRVKWVVAQCLSLAGPTVADNWRFLALIICDFLLVLKVAIYTVLPAKSDSDVMFCLQLYQSITIDRSLVY